MGNFKFSTEELMEMEALEIRGGAKIPGDSIMAQSGCSNTAEYCGSGVDQDKCTNKATRCGAQENCVMPPSQGNCDKK